MRQGIGLVLEVTGPSTLVLNRILGLQPVLVAAVFGVGLQFFSGVQARD